VVADETDDSTATPLQHMTDQHPADAVKRVGRSLLTQPSAQSVTSRICSREISAGHPRRLSAASSGDDSRSLVLVLRGGPTGGSPRRLVDRTGDNQ
jgi:hypothetical protein